MRWKSYAEQWVLPSVARNSFFNFILDTFKMNLKFKCFWPYSMYILLLPILWTVCFDDKKISQSVCIYDIYYSYLLLKENLIMLSRTLILMLYLMFKVIHSNVIRWVENYFNTIQPNLFLLTYTVLFIMCIFILKLQQKSINFLSLKGKVIT